MCRRTSQQQNGNDHGSDNELDYVELSKLDMELAKQNFHFYEKNKGGSAVECFELPLVLVGK